MVEDPLKGTKDADVIYTDVWVSMGESEETWRSRIDALHPYQVNDEMMDNASEKAIFMHCLPAFHGNDTDLGEEISKTFGDAYPNIAKGEMEVTDSVMESKQSVVFEEAENRLHTIKAVMLATMKDMD